jgi:ubiquitin C-terminal hydrolase
MQNIVFGSIPLSLPPSPIKYPWSNTHSPSLKSWADLVKKSGPPSIPLSSPVYSESPKHSPFSPGIIDILADFQYKYKGKLVYPKGLINNGNSCFLNSILQPILHCIPFYNLLRFLSNRLPKNTRDAYPLLNSMYPF